MKKKISNIATTMEIIVNGIFFLFVVFCCGV